MPNSGIALGAGRIDLWVDPPYPDETFSSVMDRAAQAYGTNSDSLFKRFAPEIAWCPRWMDLDALGSIKLYERVLDAFMAGTCDPSAFGLPREALSAVARNAYCPICFIEDLRAGRTPYFRWQWTIAVVTLCHAHGTPLFPWRRLHGRRRTLPLRWIRSPSPRAAMDFAWFGADLSCAHRAEWDLKDPSSALSLVSRLQTDSITLGPTPNLTRRRFEPYDRWVVVEILGIASAQCPETMLPPLAATLRPKSRIRDLFGVPPPNDPYRRPANCSKYFYSIASPAWRRSILWFTARAMYPVRRETLLERGNTLPGGLLSAPMLDGITGHRLATSLEGWSQYCEGQRQASLKA